jgi:hypothetical protein
VSVVAALIGAVAVDARIPRRTAVAVELDADAVEVDAEVAA